MYLFLLFSGSAFLEEKFGKKEVTIKPKNRSRLDELKSNLLEEDDEEVPPDMVMCCHVC